MILSVIIPYFDAKDNLESLVTELRSIEKLELIVVDDCSNMPIGNSFDVYDNVKVVRHAENKGAGGARNTGLSQAKGEWVTFLDSDDSLFITNNLLDLLERDGTNEVIFFGVRSVVMSTKQPSQREGEYNLHLSKSHESSISRKIILHRFLFPYGKFIRRSFIINHRLEFDETPVSNDTMFVARLGIKTTKYSFLTDVFYEIRLRPGSLVTNYKTENFICRIRVNKELTDLYVANGLKEYTRNPFLFVWQMRHISYSALLRGIIEVRMTYNVCEMFRLFALFLGNKCLRK